MTKEEIKEKAIEKADEILKILGKESCEDVVDRTEAIKKLKTAYFDSRIQSAKKDPCIVDAMVDWAIRQIKSLPPVQPKAKTGKWVGIEYDAYADGNPVYDVWECSCCGEEHYGEEDTLTPYCPNCGAEMGDDEE